MTDDVHPPSPRRRTPRKDTDVAPVRSNSLGMVLAEFVERYESLLHARQSLTEDMAVVIAEAKVQGVNPKVFKMVIKERALTLADQQKRAEEEELKDDYIRMLEL